MHNLNFSNMGFPLYCQVESNREHNVINGFHMDNTSKIQSSEDYSWLLFAYFGSNMMQTKCGTILINLTLRP